MPLTYHQGPAGASIGGDRAIGTITFDANYQTGGLALDASRIGLTRAPMLVLSNEIAAGAHAGKRVAWDPSSGKLVAFTAAGAEVAANTDLSTMQVRVLAVAAP